MPFESEPACVNAYGCIQVKTGEEKKIAKTISLLLPEVETHAIMQKKHKSRNGIRSYSSSIMIPGYILFHTSKSMLVSKIFAINSICSILTYDDNQWYLRGEDLRYAKWIFDNKGTIGISVVFMEGDRIKIIDGPLKEVEGKIVTIDKRNRNALVALGFQQQVFKVWLAFEWMEKPKV